MPVPAIVGVAALVGRLFSVLSTRWGWMSLGALAAQGGDIWEAVKAWAVEEVARRSGLNLDPEDPFSDASMAGAVGARIGVTVRSLKDRSMIREDLENYAVGLVSSRAGYEIRSVSNVAILREDLQRIACAILTEKLQLPLGILPAAGGEINAEEIKQNLLGWAKAELLSQVGEGVSISLDELQQIGDVEGLAVQLNERLSAMGSPESVTARQIALHVSNRLAVSAIADYGRVSEEISKRTRRQLQLRAAQSKFRAAHGNRQKYVPLGMVATVIDEP